MKHFIDKNTSLFVRKRKISSNGEGRTCNVGKPPCTILEPQSALYKSSYRRKCSGTELYICIYKKTFPNLRAVMDLIMVIPFLALFYTCDI